MYSITFTYTPALEEALEAFLAENDRHVLSRYSPANYLGIIAELEKEIQTLKEERDNAQSDSADLEHENECINLENNKLREYERRANTMLQEYEKRFGKLPENT
jgi:FtsZ-binding cell division protein ZapB